VGTAAADPGWKLANACSDINMAQSVVSAESAPPNSTDTDAQASRRAQGKGGGSAQIYRRAGASWVTVSEEEPLPMGVIAVEDRESLAERYAAGLSEFGVPPSPRRTVAQISWEDTKLSVQQQFKEPDTSELEKWLWLAPLLCALIGTLFSMLHAAWDLYEARQNAKVHAYIAAMGVDGQEPDAANQAGAEAAADWSLKPQEDSLDWALENIEDDEESSQQIGAPAASRCAKCAAELDPSDKLCTSCGTTVVAGASRVGSQGGQASQLQEGSAGPCPECQGKAGGCTSCNDGEAGAADGVVTGLESAAQPMASAMRRALSQQLTAASSASTQRAPAANSASSRDSAEGQMPPSRGDSQRGDEEQAAEDEAVVAEEVAQREDMVLEEVQETEASTASVAIPKAVRPRPPEMPAW